MIIDCHDPLISVAFVSIDPMPFFRQKKLPGPHPQGVIKDWDIFAFPDRSNYRNHNRKIKARERAGRKIRDLCYTILVSNQLTKISWHNQF